MTGIKVIHKDELKEICQVPSFPSMISREGATIKVHIRDALDYLPAGFSAAPTRMVKARGDDTLCFSYYTQQNGKNNTPKFAFRFGIMLLNELKWEIGETRVNCFFKKIDPTKFYMIAHETGNKITVENKHINAGKVVMNAFFNFNKPVRRTTLDYEIVKLGETDVIQVNVII